MAVFTVHSENVKYHYKTHFCTKATLILILTSGLSIMFPVIFTYRSHGFWLRTDTYQEQPDVSFKYDYLLIVETSIQEKYYICSNLPNLTNLSKSLNLCTLIKAREEDKNKDGYKDLLHFVSHVHLPSGPAIHGLTLLLLFDYKLSSYCRVQMQTLALVQHSSTLSGAGLSVTADLSFTQRHPLNPKQLHLLYNTSVMPPTSAFQLSSVIREYALRNVSAQLTNVHTIWHTMPVVGEPFVVDVTIPYTEATVRYTPTVWQVLRLGWAQFFPVLIVSVFVFRAIRNFIISEQLVYTYKQVPWTKF